MNNFKYESFKLSPLRLLSLLLFLSKQLEWKTSKKVLMKIFCNPKIFFKKGYVKTQIIKMRKRVYFWFSKNCPSCLQNTAENGEAVINLVIFGSLA